MQIRGGQAEIATDTKSLDNRYAYYVSNGDVIEANIQGWQCDKAVFQKGRLLDSLVSVNNSWQWSRFFKFARVNSTFLGRTTHYRES